MEKKTKTSKFKCFENETNLKKASVSRVHSELYTDQQPLVWRQNTTHETPESGPEISAGDMREE